VAYAFAVDVEEPWLRSLSMAVLIAVKPFTLKWQLSGLQPFSFRLSDTHTINNISLSRLPVYSFNQNSVLQKLSHAHLSSNFDLLTCHKSQGFVADLR
jgi:hypothetical protein